MTRNDGLPANPWIIDAKSKGKAKHQQWPKIRGGERQ
jgi:hypothetical protein